MRRFDKIIFMIKKKEKKYFLGIGLNLFDVGAILLREDNKVILEVEKERKEISANETISILLDLFVEILEKARPYRDNIKSGGLALGGIVDNKKGIVHWPQREDLFYTYISLPLKAHLEKKFGFPLILENDANASAWAEYLLNFSQYRNIIYMFSGVGCGLILNGQLYRGKDGGAGEVFLLQKRTMTSYLGDFSFLQQWPRDLNIVKRTKELISLGKETPLIKRITPTGELSLKDIFEEAKRDKIARQVLKEAAFCLGVKIAFLVNLLNPEVVIIGGGLEEAGEFFLEEIKEVVNNFSFREMFSHLKIVFSPLGKKATPLGAGLLALGGGIS